MESELTIAQKKDTIILCSVLGGLIGIPLLILLVHLFIRSCKSVTACVRKRKEDMRERKEARIVEKREVERHERIEAEMHEERKRFWLSKRPGKTYEESGSHPHGKVHAPPLPYL